jgi:hypothetical protein
MLTVNSGIRQLTVSENMVGAEGARAIGLALPDNPSLQILNLHKCGIGPDGAKFIAQGLSKHAVLTELSVGLNNVMDDGAAEFAKMIKVNRSIHEFYLEDNGIEGFGAKLMAEALRCNDCLETLWMVGNMVPMDVVAAFVRAGLRNKALTRLGITCPKSVPVPPAVLEDLEQLHKAMRERTRSFQGKCQDPRGNHRSRPRQRGRSPGPPGVARDQDQGPGEAWQAAQIQRPGAAQDPAGVRECSWGPREAPPERPQQVVLYDEQLEIDELPEMDGNFPVHASQGTALVDISADPAGSTSPTFEDPAPRADGSILM